MAGTKGRSGGDRSGSKLNFVKFDPQEPAPTLEPTYESITAWISWIAREQAAQRMDRADARELRDHAKAMVTAMRAKHSEKELEEMRELVARAEAAQKKAAAKVVESRYRGETVGDA